MSDPTTDARAMLRQRLAEAESASKTRDSEAVFDLLDEIAELVPEAVSADETRDRLRHGCRRVAALADDEPLVAAAYCAAMRRRVEE